MDPFIHTLGAMADAEQNHLLKIIPRVCQCICESNGVLQGGAAKFLEHKKAGAKFADEVFLHKHKTFAAARRADLSGLYTMVFTMDALPVMGEPMVNPHGFWLSPAEVRTRAERSLDAVYTCGSGDRLDIPAKAFIDLAAAIERLDKAEVDSPWTVPVIVRITTDTGDWNGVFVVQLDPRQQ